MNLMKKAIGKHRTLMFLDFEGTGISHEMIAFGAVKVTLDRNYNIKKTFKGIKFYVKAKHPITGIVTRLTGITEDTLKEKGISFKEAIEQIKDYLGEKEFNNTSFMYFGSHDCRILNKSLENSPDADENMVQLMVHRAIDVSLILSTFVRDDNNNPLSLLNYMKVFDVKQVGEPHDPINDAIHLMLLYKAFMKKSNILYEEYLKILPHKKEIPEPIREILKDILDNKVVTKKDLEKKLKEYIG